MDRLLEGTLNKLPCGLSDIMHTLEHGYYLQYFNRRVLQMGSDTATHLRNACGYVKPERLYPFPPADEVLDYMNEYAIPATYGLSYQDCMHMKRSDWIRLKRRMRSQPPRPNPDPLIQIRDLLKGIIDVYTKPAPNQQSSGKASDF